MQKSRRNGYIYSLALQNIRGINNLRVSLTNQNKVKVYLYKNERVSLSAPQKSGPLSSVAHRHMTTQIHQVLGKQVLK